MDTDDAGSLTGFIPFAATLDIKVVNMTSERLIATMSWAEDRCTSGGILHGGALMALADTAGALCAVANLPPGASTTTIESKTNFVPAVRGGVVTATSTPLHTGRRTIVDRMLGLSRLSDHRMVRGRRGSVTTGVRPMLDRPQRSAAPSRTLAMKRHTEAIGPGGIGSAIVAGTERKVS